MVLRPFIALTVAVMAVVASAMAQPAESRAPSRGGSAPETVEQAPRQPGDVVHFKNGRKLAGVQIIRENLATVEVIPAPGVESLLLPRSLIDSIEYDEIEHGDGNWLLGNEGSKLGRELMQGREISPELHSKITKPLGNGGINFENADFMGVLEELAVECGLEVIFGEEVRELPEEDRFWSVELGKGKSLLYLLQTSFTENFPDLEWSYQFDKIAIEKKKKSAPATAEGAKHSVELAPEDESE